MRGQLGNWLSYLNGQDTEDNMGTKCPRCGYERKSADSAPEWQCPSCGVAYAKVSSVKKTIGSADSTEKAEKLVALSACKECGTPISKKAEKCPKCGAPQKKKTSVLTWLVTVILILWVIGYVSQLSTPPAPAPAPANVKNAPNRSDNAQKAATPSLAYSTASYAEVDREVGCSSTYSDNKKEDIFNTKYKNHIMTWSGEVVLAESTEASLNVDGKGTQDLSVTFLDKQAGYNLEKGKVISVTFVMRRAGGCFLPFSGDNARF